MTKPNKPNDVLAPQVPSWWDFDNDEEDDGSLPPDAVHVNPEDATHEVVPADNHSMNGHVAGDDLAAEEVDDTWLYDFGTPPVEGGE